MRHVLHESALNPKVWNARKGLNLKMFAVKYRSIALSTLSTTILVLEKPEVVGSQRWSVEGLTGLGNAMFCQKKKPALQL